MMSECNHDCSSCSQDCDSRTAPESFKVKANEYSNVKKVIGIVSGKGGVGKSLVTSLLAVAARRKGFSAAVLDADITGPSIPKAFGISGQAKCNETMMFPVETKTGIKVMSINLLLEDPSQPVIWRGPILAGTVKQFWTDVAWGDADYMFVDMPPGTGDVPLTVFQSLPVDGIVIVTSPQELVSMIVAKAANMAHKMDIPMLGLVENFSYFDCPHCHERFNIYGESHIDEVAGKFGIESIAKIPVDTRLSAACDAGAIEDVEADYLDKLFP